MRSNELSMCLIVKNEINNIEGLMSDLLPVVEEINVVDTGSTDGTLQKLEEFAAKNPNLHIHHYTWDDHFADARNFSFSKATKPWVGWCDGDDRLNPQDLAKFKNEFMDDANVDCWLMDYHYSFLPNGEPSITLGRERFMRKVSSPRWHGAIHECIDLSSMRTRNYADLKFIHKKDKKANIDHRRNIRILEKEYAKNSKDARTSYYYGKELFDSVDPRGIEILEKYLELPGKWFDDEINARFRLAKHYHSQSRFTEAVNMAEKIYHLDGTRARAEAYWIWGRVEQDLRNYGVAADWFLRCLKTPPPPPRVLGLEYYTWNPRWRLAECYESMGEPFKALQYAKEAQKFIQNNVDLDKLVERLQPKAIGPLRVLQYGPAIRNDSINVPEDCYEILKPGSFDGATISITSERPPFEMVNEIAPLIKPGGFLWVHHSLNPINVPEMQELGTCEYEKVSIANYVKVNPQLKTIGSNYSPTAPTEFGPTRLRIQTMLKAAIKAGHRILGPSEKSDIYISDWLNGNERSDFLVMDICEELRLDAYLHKGLAHASLIIVCSSQLAEYVRKLAKQPVAIIDDSFEFTWRDWL